MTYVMSDIHGNKSRFEAMLKKINFSQDDTLYILGDVIDRGPNGIAILQEIINTPNIKMILGNHEHMMIDYLYYMNCEYGKNTWCFFNGGNVTHLAYCKLSQEEKEKIKNFLLTLPSSIDISIDGQKFHLVHGYPASTVFEQVWNRIWHDSENPIPETMTIVGHTPVQHFGQNQIFKRPGVIDIDCGCARKDGQLGCLRLDDMAEFYVK